MPRPQGLIRVLSQHLEIQGDLGLGSDDLVFCGIDGRPVHQEGIVKDAFKPALERAGLPRSVRLYDLRHPHATLLLLAGVNPKVVPERLGHSSIKTTQETYSHVPPSVQEDGPCRGHEPYGQIREASHPHRQVATDRLIREPCSFITRSESPRARRRSRSG